MPQALQINLRLAAAGDAVQQDRLRLRGIVDGLAQGRERGGLLGVEREVMRRQVFTLGLARDALRTDANDTALFQGLRGGAQFTKLGRLHRRVRFLETFNDFELARSAPLDLGALGRVGGSQRSTKRRSLWPSSALRITTGSTARMAISSGQQ